MVRDSSRPTDGLVVSRRSFFGLVASTSLMRPTGASAQRRTSVPLDAVPVRRTGKVEVAFKSPGPQPNGLQATKDGLWIIDQSAGSKAYLVDYGDGRVLRSFETEAVRPSGLTFDGEALWIGSTFSYENIRCDAMTGRTIERRPTPGCTTYSMAGDPPLRRSPLAGGPLAQPRPAPAGPPPVQPPTPRLTQAPHVRFQGAHGQEWQDGKLWTTSTSARAIYRVDPKTWVVEKRFDAPGPRPHGLALEGRFLWHGDGDLNAFFKFDPDSGEIVEKILLTDADPVAHGLTIWNGTLWYCDDVGVVCRMSI